MFLRVRTGSQTIDVPNTGAAGVALFEFDLSTLAEQGTWYDLLIGVTSANTLVDLTTGVFGGPMPSDIVIDGQQYGFREWESDLKVVRFPV